MSDPEINPLPADAPKPAATAKPAAKSNLGWGIAAFVAVAILCGVFIAKGDSGPSGGGALVACENFVKDDLKSPGTADFSGESLSNDGSTYVLSGSVDSQNGFGGVVRNDFTCTVTGDGDNWTLVSLEGLTN